MHAQAVGATPGRAVDKIGGQIYSRVFFSGSRSQRHRALERVIH